MNKRPYRPYGGKRRKPWLIALCALLALGVLGFSILEGLVFAGARTQVTGNPGLMVIFGCKVESWGPSILLSDRLDAALDYLQEHPDMTVVVTGGQGDDEYISEAQCMYDYLTAHGIEAERILREDQSRNTWQNVNLTKELLEEEGVEAEGGVVLVSSGFHLTRIRLLWSRAEGVGPVGVLAAPVTHRPSAVQMFFREPLALVKSFLFDR